jgi:hypothetical protein
MSSCRPMSRRAETRLDTHMLALGPTSFSTPHLKTALSPPASSRSDANFCLAQPHVSMQPLPCTRLVAPTTILVPSLHCLSKTFSSQSLYTTLLPARLIVPALALALASRWGAPPRIWIIHYFCFDHLGSDLNLQDFERPCSQKKLVVSLIQ